MVLNDNSQLASNTRAVVVESQLMCRHLLCADELTCMGVRILLVRGYSR